MKLNGRLDRLERRLAGTPTTILVERAGEPRQAAIHRGARAPIWLDREPHEDRDAFLSRVHRAAAG